MKTPEEIKQAMYMCSCHYESCDGCPYFGDSLCWDKAAADALKLVEQMETQIPCWIPVEERLPEEGRRVLTLDKWGHIHDRELKRYFTGDKAVFRPDGLEPGRDVTHWMPLPEPPGEPTP